jgi:hypothetical protein
LKYLSEINAFERRMRRAPLSVNAQLLWYKLMQFDNRLNWEPQFQIDNNRLCYLFGTKISKSVMTAARAELIEDGLLIFTPGVRGKPSTYRLVSVEGLEAPELAPDLEPGDFLGEVREDPTTYFGYTEALSLEAQEITEKLWAEFLPSEKPTPGDVRDVFFCLMHQERKEDGTFEMTFPEDRKGLLAYAFDQARQRGAVNWKYVSAVLRRLGQRGINTVEEARDYEDTRRTP